jgi:phospholipid/cholesterol/gamma-HCH transport system substrate-binding protein
MVTQSPQRTSVLAAVAFVLSCIGLTVFVWTQFGGTVPFSAQGYRVHALFRETGLLTGGADVRISGVDVGKVASVQAKGIDSLVTMDIQHVYAPLPADTRAILRQKTLLGEAYVELSTGTRSGPKLPDGGTIPPEQIGTTQQLDQVLATFDTPTQRNLEAFLSGSATALAGNGQNLNEATGALDPALTQLQALVGELNAQQPNLRALVSSSATALGTLSSRASDLETLITAGDEVMSATAARDASLTATVNALPPFLSQLRGTLGTLNTTLGIAKPSLHVLRPVAPLLTPALSDVITLSGPAVRLLHEAPSLLDAATVALPSIARLTNALHPTVDALLPAVREVAPVISFIGLYNRELIAAMANLSAAQEATAPAVTRSGTASYLRAISVIGNESIFGQSIREPTDRANTYFAPGELANIARGGLLSANCNNVHNVSQVPVSFTNVPCRVQPPFVWNRLSRYFPHVTRAALPPGPKRR